MYLITRLISMTKKIRLLFITNNSCLLVNNVSYNIQFQITNMIPCTLVSQKAAKYSV